ncbi:MAG: hypothetical protein A2V66_06215 [Ignavibacteria bacterium RBG_13_36_8]|nr:MAG: hypothetical protein A2V66_06215 [Ignavibacteria bacterium RBG_13_36_8]
MEKLKTEQTSGNEAIISHSDKLVGVFTNPVETFSKMALLPAQTRDWLIPVLCVIVFAILSNFLLLRNPIIRSQAIEQQMKLIEENFDKAVESGSISRDVADQQLEQIRDNIDTQMQAGMIIQFVATFFIVFIVFFIVSGVFFLIVKFIFKDTGTYSVSMVAYGLPQYVLILQIIVIVITALATDTLLIGTSLATLLKSDTSTLGGFIFSKIDPFRIWFYVIVSIAYAKMFQAKSTVKYLITIFGLWLGVGIIIFFISQYIPILRPLAL